MVTLKRGARVALGLLVFVVLACVSARELDHLAKSAAVGARQVGCSDAVGALLDAGAAREDGGSRHAD